MKNLHWCQYRFLEAPPRVIHGNAAPSALSARLVTFYSAYLHKRFFPLIGKSGYVRSEQVFQFTRSFYA